MTEFASEGLWLRFAIAALATWRITHLLVREDGPFDAIARLRAKLGDVGSVLDCFYCMSLWVAALVALFVTTVPEIWWCVWLALSAAACLLNRINEPAVVMQHLKGEKDGMLWTEAGTDVEPGDLHAAGQLEASQRDAHAPVDGGPPVRL